MLEYTFFFLLVIYRLDWADLADIEFYAVPPLTFRDAICRRKSTMPLEFPPVLSLLTYCHLMQSNPIARWHICPGSINGVTFSTDGAYIATVGRDGIS